MQSIKSEGNPSGFLTANWAVSTKTLHREHPADPKQGPFRDSVKRRQNHVEERIWDQMIRWPMDPGNFDSEVFGIDLGLRIRDRAISLG